MTRLLLTAALAFAACSGDKTPQQSPESTAGLTPREDRLAVPGGKIWYKVTGTGPGTPVVLLHGGPGLSSFYLKPLEELADERPVIRYDQLGGGKSDKVTDTTMFSIPHFVSELESLRAHLGVAKWHVLGHSWGTMLAIEYYRAHPERVASLTFGSPVFDFPAYTLRARALLKSLPDSMQRAVAKAEAAQAFEDPGYTNALNEFYARYVFRNPVGVDLDSTMRTNNAAIYNYMQGPSEFTITGTLKNYNARAFLKDIKVPTLFTVGEFDEVGPELVKSFADSVGEAAYMKFSGAAHITTWDARDANIRVVREFLRNADATSR